MAVIIICRDFGAQENTIRYCFLCFLIYLPWVIELDAMIFVFWLLSFKPVFSLSSSTFIKWLFTFCHKICIICISEVEVACSINASSLKYMYKYIDIQCIDMCKYIHSFIFLYAFILKWGRRVQLNLIWMYIFYFIMLVLPMKLSWHLRSVCM